MTAATPGEAGSGHRGDVEGLRALAVVLVVAFHAAGSAVSGGFVGVDIFFVISGFLITGLLVDEITRTRSLSFARFYGRRARRLLPMATLVLVATTIAFAVVLSAIDRKPLVADVRAAALYVANWRFAADALNYQTAVDKSPVLHYWSLSIEEQFYLLWPVILVLVARPWRRVQNRTASRRRMTVALALIFGGSLAASVLSNSTTDAYAYYGLHTRAWELAAGGLVAMYRDQLHRIPTGVAWVGGWAALAGVLTSAFTYSSDTNFPGSAALLPVLSTAVLIAVGARARRGVTVSRLLSTAPTRYVGRISYSLYLWHWPCLLFAALLVGGTQTADTDATKITAPATGWVAVAAVAVAVALSIFFHHLIEDPIRRSRWLAAFSPRSLALGGALTAITVASVGVIAYRVGPHVSRHVVATVQVAPGTTSDTALMRAEKVTLTQTPQEARDDHPNNDEECYASHEEEAAYPDCQLGEADGHKSVALVGDSHAEQWLPAFRRVAAERDWQLWMWAKPSCALIDLQVRLPRFGHDYPWCTAWRQNVIEQLRAHGPYDAIVVTHFSSYPHHLGTADGEPLSYDEAVHAWAKAWREMRRTLATMTDHVVVLRDDPLAPHDVPGCIADHGKDAGKCNFPRKPAFKDLNALWHAEHRGANNTTEFLDLNDLLCPGAVCPVIWPNGMIMYRDFHHLTAHFSRFLGKYLSPRLAHIVNST